MNNDYINFDLLNDYRKLGFGPVSDSDFVTRFYPESSNFSSELREFASDGFLYNFIADAKFTLKSKVREYKGAFKDRSIKLEKNYLEKEILLSEKASAFVGIRQVNPDYFDRDKQFHYAFQYSFLLISQGVPIEVLDNCEKFLEMRRMHNSVCYERLLPYLGKKTLIKYWRLENDKNGYVVVKKGQIG